MWREEEVAITNAVASSLGVEFFIISRKNPIDTITKLVFKSTTQKAYLSFPITKVIDKPDILGKIQSFKELMTKQMIIWDPITISERRLLRHIVNETDLTKEIAIETLGSRLSLKVKEIDDIKQDIDGQIISRDYRLINQSDLIITYIPEIDGSPDISAGCQTEVHYAYELPRKVFILWESDGDPSPWIVQNATEVFKGKKMFDELLEYLKKENLIIN